MHIPIGEIPDRVPTKTEAAEKNLANNMRQLVWNMMDKMSPKQIATMLKFAMGQLGLNAEEE